MMLTQTQARGYLVTAEELEELSSRFRCELVNGELRTMAPPADEHGAVSGNLSALLWNHVRKHKLGRVYTETGYRLTSDPDTVLGPDVSFVRSERVPPKHLRKYLPFIPDLAVEVVSPTDRRGEVEDKTELWMEFGLSMLWVVRPPSKTVTVHRPGQPPITLREGDLLEGGDVVEGFACQVSEIFE